MLVFLFYLTTCTKKTAEHPLPKGLDYYPAEKGRYIIYDVDSIIYTEIPKDTIVYSYRIKEKLADSFTDNTGQSATRLERFIKKFNKDVPYDSIPWIYKEVWLVNATQKTIQVVEGNVRYTKLVFPVLENTTWNGNAANTIGEWNYIYEYLDKIETLNGKQFEKVLKVKQKKDSTAITYRNYNEKYAAGIGMVYREMTDLHSNNVVINKPVTARIERGLIYKQTFVTYGYE